MPGIVSGVLTGLLAVIFAGMPVAWAQEAGPDPERPATPGVPTGDAGAGTAPTAASGGGPVDGGSSSAADAGTAAGTADGSGDAAGDAEDLDVDLGPVSAAGQRMLDRVGGSVLQVRGFYGANRAEAFHGSAFAATDGGLLVTNYHVIARAALYPKDYRLEYRTDDGRTGRITILAVDVLHDLAVVRADGIAPAPLKLRTTIPPRGDRAYAVGYPLALGLVITEGIANGLLDNEYGRKLHYAGPLNPGMSGGPALDSRGRVFGINVSISTRGQLISFLVPAEFVGPLLESARGRTALTDARDEVGRQLRAHQAAWFAALPRRFPTQAAAGYALPAELAPFVNCSAGAPGARTPEVLVQGVTCRADVSLSVQPGLATGDFQFRHDVMVGKGLHPLQFSRQLTALAADAQPLRGSPDHVTPFRCNRDAVNLDHLKARVVLCARSYRLYDGLYDVTLTVVSLNQPDQGFVSHLNLRGMDYDAAMDFVGRYLRAMRWLP